MIHIKNLNKSFGEHRIYSNLNLDIGQGEFITILGRSGIGKSVLLKEIFNKNPCVEQCKQLKMALVLQKPMVMSWLNAKNNILLGNRELENSEAFNSVISTLRLNEHLNKFPHQMSGGILQRVALARSLIKDADVYLFDEPLSSIDEITAHFIREDLKILLQNKTILWVTHSISEALQLATRILILGPNGRIALDEKPMNVNSQKVFNLL
jgi:ABC-type nitrate/sulfonate/bicarbonate transport system ATPase subunit